MHLLGCLQVLRHLLVQHPPRAATRAEIDQVNRTIEKITAQGSRIATTMTVCVGSWLSRLALTIPVDVALPVAVVQSAQ
jgi:hypothetical protein